MKGKLDQGRVAAILHDVSVPCPGCGRMPTMKMVGDRYGVTRQMVHQIANGTAWPDVPFSGGANDNASPQG